MVFRHGPRWRDTMGEQAPMAMAAALRYCEAQWIARERATRGV